MADKIYLRAGNAENMPALADRELAFVRDEKALYIGTEEGNLKLADATMPQQIAALVEDVASLERAAQNLAEVKLSADAAAAQLPLAADAELAAVISAFNALVSAMKASGIMENS